MRGQCGWVVYLSAQIGHCMSNWRRQSDTAMYQRIAIPQHYLATTPIPPEIVVQPTVEPSQGWWDLNTMVILLSIFLREFVSTICLLILSSRLGGDLFIAGPIVTLYVCIVFRRPLNNPYVAFLACASSGDWKNANVSGYPWFKKGQTSSWVIAFYFVFLLIAQGGGALAAAEIRAYNDGILGYEFMKGGAWGSSQLHYHANLDSESTCWNKNETKKIGNLTGNIAEIPVHLYGSKSAAKVKDSGECDARIKWRWWMMEDLVATLFLLVAYVHVWRWLRSDSIEGGNANQSESRYWEEIISFSTASASLSFMTSIAFPTAHAGLHTSLFVTYYQYLSTDRDITAYDMGEPGYRLLGGAMGCLLAVVYEWMVAFVSEMKDESTSWVQLLVYRTLYLSEMPTKKTVNNS